MTEREAIEILSRPFSVQEAPKEILDAHRLAISALEKQEVDKCCETCKYKHLDVDAYPCCDCIRAKDHYVPYTGITEVCKDCEYDVTMEEMDEAVRVAIFALENQEQVNTQSVNSTHTTYPNALESLNILEQAKDDKGCVPMSLVRQAFRNILEKNRWIPVTERLPETTDPVNVTWSNNDPVTYYEDIRGKRFTATACYHRGKWWWYSSVCQDLLDEYGKSCMDDEIDEAIEILAWRPLPEPYTEEES